MCPEHNKKLYVRYNFVRQRTRWYCVHQIQSDSPSLLRLLDANALGAGPRYKAHVLVGVVRRF